MILFGFSPEVCDILEPKAFQPTPEWVCRNVIMPAGSEIRGPFRLDLFPHSREPLECFDDPAIRTISLQWASRVGKTVIMQAVMAKTAATAPNPMAFADADQTSVNRVIRRLWKILEKVPALADRCPPRHLRSAERIEFPDFLIHGAWSGSPSAAADYAAFVVCKNEVDKMTKKKSDEADFFKLMDERAKGFIGSKILNASTPGYKGRSRIETARLGGDNRARYVPCPKCNHWQVLVTGNGSKPGGIRWEKLRNGRSDPQLAFETAWYECEKCLRKITNQERYDLLNAGVWVKEGQTIAGSGVISGKPNRPGSHASFGPLGTHYSLLPAIHWGTIAREFLSTRGTIQGRRNYHNSWDGLTWDDAPQKLAHQEMVARLGTDNPKGRCPAWTVFLTRGVDVLADGHTYQWVVTAWGRGAQCQPIDWGLTSGDADMERRVLADWYPHADGGAPLRAALTLIDSGDGEHTDEVYAFCKRVRGCVPCKGAQYSNFPGFFRLSGVSSDNDRERELLRRLGGQYLVIVNTDRSNWWVENSLAGGDENVIDSTAVVISVEALTFSLPAEAAQDIEFLDQLTNEYPDEQQTKEGYEFWTWKKRPHSRNEYRDALRYARVAAEWMTNHGATWNEIKREIRPKTAETTVQQPVTTTDGRNFLITER